MAAGRSIRIQLRLRQFCIHDRRHSAVPHNPRENRAILQDSSGEFLVGLLEFSSLYYVLIFTFNSDISRKQDFFDRLIHYIGLAIAPKDFVRAEHRLQALQRMRDANDLFAVEVEDMSGIAQTRFRQHLVFYCELACWLLKMGAWWCLWGAGCVLCMLFSTSQRRAITQNTTTGTALYGEDFDCGVVCPISPYIS